MNQKNLRHSLYKQTARQNESSALAMLTYMLIGQLSNTNTPSDKPVINAANNTSHYKVLCGNSTVRLTRRQAQCLFYLIHGKTAKETARIISISNRTVEVYLNQIREKVGCDYKQAIIEKLNIVDFLTNYPWKS